MQKAFIGSVSINISFFKKEPNGKSHWVPKNIQLFQIHKLNANYANLYISFLRIGSCKTRIGPCSRHEPAFMPVYSLRSI